MGHVFQRQPHAVLPLAVRGEGNCIFDSGGKRYLDACGGAAVSCLGHSHPKVTAAIKRQLDDIAFAHSSFFTTEAAERLADHLAARTPGDLDWVFYVSGGSEAVEAALKLARQYFTEIGQPQRRHLIARRQSYHGNTLGALSAGGNFWRRQQFEPLLIDARHIAPCYAYRFQEEGESEEEYGRRVADELEAAILELGADTVAAFICEPVVGATSGAVVPVPGYLKRIREICDTYGVLLIFDEVMCGMGRTGSLFACEQEGVAPDIVTVAKGLGAGYQPIGAMIASERIYRTVYDGSGFFQHGHTYMAHPAACAAGLAVQQAIEEEDLLANVQRRGEQLKARLEERFGNHHHVGDVRGRGLFIGLEFVADRASKAPFDPALKVNAKIRAAALERGLMIYAMGGTIDGRQGDHVLLAPSYTTDDAEIDEIVDKLGAAVDEATGAAAA
jgi:hypothetical protein